MTTLTLYPILIPNHLSPIQNLNLSRLSPILSQNLIQRQCC